ncbi:MAG: pyridoxamine 5'-phosphate oxidase family protein [Acidimicrobiales bacterium]|jgi:nitroimidazol reductase NimA-like FMN-containing flavoprotein (pyridoxamine 5'-phosphate oxidase superfamily)
MLSEDEGVAVLEQDECLELLGRSSIGRVAVSMGAVPAVFPVNFAVLDQAIVFWTSTGTKLDAAMRNAVVAFEVDDVDALYHEGSSVLVVGIADELRDPALVERAKRLPLAPWAEGPREHVVVIRPEFISGRRIVHHSNLASAEVEGSSRL